MHTDSAQIILTISDIYFEAIKQDTTLQHLNIKLKLSTFILYTKCVRTFLYALQCAVNQKSLRTTVLDTADIISM
jgi:hypothetical protein